MNMPTIMPRLKGFRFPREIIAYAVWAYHRFALSTADVEDLLAARGVIVSRETVRLWVNRFGRHFSDCIRRDRPRPNDKWHMDEVVIMIRGKKHWLWRAIVANGDTLDILVQTRRNAKAAKRFFKGLVAKFGEPRVVITPYRDIAAQCTAGQWTNCAAISNQSEYWHRTLTIVPIKVSITRSKSRTDQLAKERSYSASLSLIYRLRDFCLPMTKST